MIINQKVIFHIDMNQFYANCAMIRDPYLKDRVFVVGGPDGSTRGVISTASYKAREYGIKSGMSVRDAYDLYDKLLVVPVDFPFYNEKSSEFYSYFTNFTDLIYKASIDEVYLDVTELCIDTAPLILAKKFQDDLLEKFQLPCSIGISHTKFLAKMASDMKKPLGITIINQNNIKDKILSLPINEMYGVGIKTSTRLIKVGINNIADILKVENRNKILKIVSNNYYEGLIKELTGTSDDIVDPAKNEEYQSISQETTFSYNIDEEESILDAMEALTKLLHKRLTKLRLITKGVGIKFRNSKFKTTTRSHLLLDYTNDIDLIWNNIEVLFHQNYKGEELRLVGVFTYQIIKEEQYKKDYNLFNYKETN